MGGTYCQPIDDTDARYCLQDCTNDGSLCAADETCNDIGNCVPRSGACDGNVKACSESAPHGSCPDGQSCYLGQCSAPWSVVETDATFSIVDDIAYYGMLYSTFNFSTRYNDRLMIYRVGNDDTVEPGDGFVLETFTDPISGDTYGALVEDCPTEVPPGGPVGLCEACDRHADCAGHTGDYGGAYCQPLNDPSDDIWYCLIDCTEDAGACPVGTTCGPDANCIPDSGTCEGESGLCSATSMHEVQEMIFNLL